MDFPIELFEDEQAAGLALPVVELFHDRPLIITDKLGNSIFLNGKAEVLLGDRAEALVNRFAFSLLGFGKNDQLPKGLLESILGDGTPWRGVIDLTVDAGEQHRWFFLEGSTVRQGSEFVCGILRLSADEVLQP